MIRLQIGRAASALAPVLLFLLLAAPGPALAEESDKNDRVTLRNGNVIDGEVKNLRAGLLRFKTDSMDTVYIEWLDVVRLVSEQSLQVETEEGDLYLGSLVESEGENRIRVVDAGSHVELEVKEVVQITPIETGFLKQLDGSLSFGLSFTKASDVAQMSFAGSAKRRKPTHSSELSLTSIVTSDSDEETTTSKNNNLKLSHTRFLGHRWTTGGGVSFQQNDELGIDFRVLLTGLGGRALRKTNRQLLILSAGLAVNREDSSDGELQTSLEAMTVVNWNVFQYKNPETDISVGLEVFPSISDRGRVRSNFDTTLQREIVSDFFWDLQLYVSYDSDPPSDDAASSDYGFVTSFGWSF